MGIASNVCVCLRSAAKVLRRRLPSASGRGSYSQFRYPSPAFCIMVMLFVSTIIPHITSETYFKNVKKSYEAAYAEYHRAAAADRAALAAMSGPPSLPPPPLKLSIATPQRTQENGEPDALDVLLGRMGDNAAASNEQYGSQDGLLHRTGNGEGRSRSAQPLMPPLVRHA